MKKMSKRLLSLLLAVIMVVGVLPVMSFAEGETTTYTKISTMEELTTGQYVMVVSTGYAPGALDDIWVTAVQPTIEGDTVTADAKGVWTITVTGNTATLKDRNSVSIAPKGGNNNGIQAGDYSWNVTCADGTFTFAGQVSDTVTLASNTSSENKFRAYKNTTVNGNPAGYPSQFTLYKLDESGSTEPESKVATPVISPDTKTVNEKSVSVTISCATEGATIYYTTDGTVPTVNEGNAYNAEASLSVTVDISTVVKAFAVKEGMPDSDIATATYTYEAPAAVVPISTALAGETNQIFAIEGIVTCVDGSNVYVQDATGGICLNTYKASCEIPEVSLGDKVIASGKRSEYKKMPQLSTITVFKKTGAEKLAAKETTIGALTTADICTYVKLTGLEVTEVYDNNGAYTAPNITVKDSEGKTIQLYKAVVGDKDTEGNWPYKVGDKIDVTAAVGCYNTTLQLRNTLASEIRLTPKTQYAKLNNTIADGDQLVVYYNKDSSVMSSTVSGSGFGGIAATPEGDFIQVTEDMAVLTAKVNDVGQYTFTNADGKYLTSGKTGNSLSFAETASDYSLWTINSVTGGVHIVNVNAAYNGSAQALEVYKNVFTTFSEKDTDYYLFNLYTLTDDKPESSAGMPAAGDIVVIYNASAEGVIGLEDELGATMSCVPATIEDGKAVVGNGGRVFTVSVSGEDYSFESNGMYLASNDAEELFLTETLDDYAKWNLEKKTDGYVMYNKAAKYTFSGGGSAKVCIEYFSGSFSGWTYKSADSAIFEMNFYPVAEGTTITDGVVNKPTVNFGTLPDAYVGADYTFSFSVDAVFGVESLTVKANNEIVSSTEADGTHMVVVPSWKISGDSLTITVTGKDTKGVAISGTATVTVVDEPVISDVTPANGSQTGSNKRPTISAKITNAGENPTITMTLNGEEVTPKYEDGVISYQSEADMPDGRTSVTVTVTRADGKTASKSWSFTVGTAQYQLYFGQLHSHTTYSDGSGSLDSALEYIKNLPDSANVDFAAFTDHSNYFDESGAANPEGALYDMSLASEAAQSKWNTYKNTVAQFNASQSDVLAIAGFEMTWSGGPGHINTFNTPGIVSRNNSTLNNKSSDAGMKAYYALLSQSEGADSISQFNHPGSTFGTFSDFAYFDGLIDSRMYMVEVGNGEGAVHAGGYFPSYEYYTMALDKGWHLAPTNNQDNHKGKWGNANDARDVILTDDFSEEGLYDAIRAMKMYATEDKNLEITYTVNGQQLGSSITEVPEKLNINVTVNDPDTSDSISKVEVIVNSGRVAYTWSDPTALATGDLNVELDPDYSYYYIRVTEGDGDIAVTAPVWVGETMKLGISSVECSTATPVTNEALTLTTTFFNSEANEATVTSVTYTCGDETLGTDTAEHTIPASGSAAVQFTHTFTEAKLQTVKVTAVVTYNGTDYTFTKTIALDVLRAENLVYIGIDASHYNEYVAGNYKDSMGNFGQLAAGYSARTVQLNTSEDLLAACENESGKYKMIILTAPSRRDGTALRDPYKTYSVAEIAALVAFNNNGGTVVLCGWGDYYESYSSFPADDHMAAQQNKVLAALGSSLRISDDETKDNTWNGGQSQRLYLSTYNFGSFLLNGVEYDAENPHNNMNTELYSQYGGASIYTVDGKIPATVTPVVYGFDTTYSADDDNDNYGGLGSIPKYTFDGADRLMVMATEQLEGKGLIVVAGAAFLSNFEVKADLDNTLEKNYSNYKICENLVQYINPVTITDIATVRAQTQTGYKYTIEGVVTSNASGYDKNTAFFDCIYVQDATGGICCFPVAGDFKIGDKVRVTGTTDFFQGEPELQVSSIQTIGMGAVAPTKATAKQITDRSVEGKLVTLSGTVVSFEKANGLVQTIMVKDAAGNVARVFIDGYITTSKDVENLAVGCKITVTGLASYDDTFNAPEGPFPRIRVRDRADVVCSTGSGQIDPPINSGNTNRPINTTKPDAKLPFADVRSNDWFYEDVEYVYNKGIMNGTAKNKFSPNADLTRGMLVTILYRMENEPAAGKANMFGDVPSGQWYTKAVAWAAENGIVNGYSNGNFGPNDSITREQLATILYRYTKYKGELVKPTRDYLNKFADKNAVSAYAVDAMNWAVAEGLINGSGDKLMPTAHATRAQVAAIIHRYLEG